MECPVCGQPAKIRKKQIMEYSTLTHLECTGNKCGFRWVTNEKVINEKPETTKANVSESKSKSGGFQFLRKE
jgi:endogenous inhibitor of DNA gyrase (YacG/DUF329 family)